MKFERQVKRQRREWDWHITLQTRHKLDDLAQRIWELEAFDPDDPEIYSLEEEIRRLPGYPREARRGDLINWVPAATPISLPGDKTN